MIGPVQIEKPVRNTPPRKEEKKQNEGKNKATKLGKCEGRDKERKRK